MFLIDDDVIGFQVSVHDLFGNEVFHGFYDAFEDFIGDVEVQKLLSFQDIAEALTLAIFLNEVEVVVLLVSTDKFQNMGTVQAV